MVRKQCGSLRRKLKKIKMAGAQSPVPTQNKSDNQVDDPKSALDSPVDVPAEPPDSGSDAPSASPHPLEDSKPDDDEPAKKKDPATSVAVQASPQDCLNCTLGDETKNGKNTTDENDGFQLYHSRTRRCSSRDVSPQAWTAPVGRVAIITPWDGVTQVKLMDALKVSQELQALVPDGIRKVRLNLRLNLLAVDTNDIESTGKLLSLKKLCGVPVQVREPHGSYGSVGVLHGIPPGVTESQLKEFIRSKAPVVSVRIPKPPGPAVVTFASPELPHHVLVGLVEHKVHQHVDRPPRCHRCGRIGHVDVACTNPPTCRRCGRSHGRSVCLAPQSCVNCGQNHDSCSNACPKWREAIRIAKYKHANKVDFTTAKAAVVGRNRIKDKKPAVRNGESKPQDSKPLVRNSERSLRSSDVDIFPPLVAMAKTHTQRKQPSPAPPANTHDKYRDVYVPDSDPQITAGRDLATTMEHQRQSVTAERTGELLRKVTVSHVISTVGKIVQGVLWFCQKLL